MDALAYIHNDLSQQAVVCEILRPTDSDSVYDGDLTETDETVEVAIFQPSSSSTVTTEGTDQDTSLTGHIVPQYDTTDTLDTVVHVGDRLRVRANPAKRYEVRTKDGVPNDIDPELFRVGLEPANRSD